MRACSLMAARSDAAARDRPPGVAVGIAIRRREVRGEVVRRGSTGGRKQPAEPFAARRLERYAPQHHVGVQLLEEFRMGALERVEGHGRQRRLAALHGLQRAARTAGVVEERVVEIEEDRPSHRSALARRPVARDDVEREPDRAAAATRKNTIAKPG